MSAIVNDVAATDRTTEDGTFSWRGWAVATVAGAVASAAANAGVRLAAVSALDVPHAFEPLQPSGAPVSSVVAAVGAGVVVAALARFTRRPVRNFLVVAGVVLVLSFAPLVQMGMADPPEYPGTTGGTLATLSLMHVVSAAIVVPLLATLPFRPGNRA
jgi:hypothetical protein